MVWFNQPWLATQIVGDVEYLFYGDVRTGRDGTLELVNPSWEPVLEAEAGALVPVYPPLPGLSARQARRLIAGLLDGLDLEQAAAETVPEDVLRRHGLPSLPVALRTLHRPALDADVEALDAGATPAHQRLAYGELLALRARVELARARMLPARKPQRYVLDAALRARLDGLASFALTTAQRRARDEILRDLERPQPMQRLLQGDVGCGKTIVAAAALEAALANGMQAAFMAPTELLAEQHFERLRAHPRRSPPDRAGHRVEPGLGRGAARAALGRRGARDRHPRADPARRRVPPPRPRRHRRAAPLRRQSTPDAARQGRAAGPAGDDRDTDPALARPHRCTATSTSR